MVRDLQSIEKELQELENQVETLSDKLKTAYQEYTEILGDTFKQQLVFSVYQICTQEYPQGFLNLSLSQQQNLQKKVRELAEKAKENFKLGGDFLKQMENQTDDSPQEEDASEESDNLFSEQWETVSHVEEQNNEATINQNILKELLTSTQQDSEAASADDTSSKHPDQILNWSKRQENAIALILENVSSQANETLKEAGILPQEFPKEMIDAALQAEDAGSMSNRAPGVLHLMLEVERKNQQQKSDNNEVMQLSIIRLRVGEMEFAAPSLNMKRRELRNMTQEVQQLQEQYHKLSKERAIAQAELAWRSSWHEDEA
ncbi:MAG: hypothetical protein BRC33_12555 [Cyanobacteria bacterium SW_9_44_58]|nr:MAG: hypothetical protein BRC33_12555 [Cyanobacteria bacterium SW_9_44_58]